VGLLLNDDTNELKADLWNEHLLTKGREKTGSHCTPSLIILKVLFVT
jgi:hypothetical protein